jgi:hypothetical protein
MVVKQEGIINKVETTTKKKWTATRNLKGTMKKISNISLTLDTGCP